MGLDLNELRDRLDNVLNQETADSLNEWINNKRDEPAEQRTIRMMMCVLDDIQSITHELTLDERNALIDELIQLYERFNNDINMRKGGQPE